MPIPLPQLRLLFLILLGAGFLCLLPASAPAAPGDAPASTPAPSPGGKPLAIKQERVRRVMIELQQKLSDLAKGLETSEPQRAKKLQEVLAQMRQLRLEDQMARIAQWLSQEKLDQAGSQQDKVMQEMRQLVELLIREDDPSDAGRDELERLEALRAQLEDAIRKQTELQRDTLRSADRPQALQQADQALARISAILQSQRALAQQTQAARLQEPHALPAQAPRQEELQRQTSALEEQLHQTGVPAAQGPEQLREAAGQQTQAAAQLAAGQGKNAVDAQHQAIAALEKAQQAISQDRDRIVRLPEDPAPALAPPQEDLARQAQALAQEMEQAAGNDVQPGGDAAQERAGAMRQAQESMKKAAGNLQKRQTNQAAQAQQQALDQLKQVRKMIQERLAQLRKESREQRLADLESRFQQMLSRQKPVTSSTAALPDKDISQWPRVALAAVPALAKEETSLADMAAQCLALLEEDGTTVVFPRMVAQVRVDLETVAARLSNRQAGSHTIALQRDIELALQELLEAVRQAQEWMKQQEAGAPKPSSEKSGSDRPQALTPPSAELKLLRSAQLRINRRTLEVDRARQDAREPLASHEFQNLADMQSHVRELTRKMAD